MHMHHTHTHTSPIKIGFREMGETRRTVFVDKLLIWIFHVICNFRNKQWKEDREIVPEGRFDFSGFDFIPLN
jgi:hypothetical protein